MYQLKRLPILEFIEQFKHPFIEDALIDCFTQGNCYHFAVILKDIYTEGRIVYSNSKGHFLLEYENAYYDITGRVDVKDAIYFDTLYYEDSCLYNGLMRDCVLKINYSPYDDNEYCKKI